MLTIELTPPSSARPLWTYKKSITYIVYVDPQKEGTLTSSLQSVLKI